MRFRDKVFLILLTIGFLCFVINEFFTSSFSDNFKDGSMVKVRVAEKEIRVELALTPEYMTKGLSGHDPLGMNEGMLFVHSLPGQYVYHMGGMTFGLDFIFINGNRVVDIAQEVPQDFSGSIKGGEDYDKVIEVNSGWTKENSIKIGDEVKILE